MERGVHMLGKTRIYTYLVDGLTPEKEVRMERGLDVISGVSDVQVSASRSTVELKSKKDVEDKVRVACDVAGVRFRVRVRK